MTTKNLTLGALEKKLLEFFPKEIAEDWDQTGLLLGNPDEKIKKIALALDPTVPAIKFAQENSCNLLLTHHPAYIDGVLDFGPGDSVFEAQGAVAYEAISRGVALMNFHTALDASDAGRAVLPSILELEQKHVLCPLDGRDPQDSKYGFGMVNKPAKNKNLTLANLSEKCSLAFDREPRVWGDFDKQLKLIGTTTGSTGSGAHINNLLSWVYNLKLDCIVCGEIKYHDALALCDSGICIVDLGHDVSELPLVNVLNQSLIDIGLNKNDIILCSQSHNWV